MAVRQLTLAALAALALAGAGRATDQQPEAVPAEKLPFGIDQKLGAKVPLDLPFRNETNRLVSLRDVCGGKPTVLVLAYYKCPHLCSQVIRGVMDVLRTSDPQVPDTDPIFETQRVLRASRAATEGRPEPAAGGPPPRMTWRAGREFNVVFVSFDPGEKAMLAGHAKVNFLAELRQPGAATGVHFLTGEKVAIEPLAEAVGFRYAFNEKTKQFDHSSGIMVLTPEGEVSRYFFGIDYPAEMLQAALEGKPEGGGGRPESVSEMICSMLKPLTGKNSATVMTTLRMAGLVTLAGVIALVSWLSLRPRRPVSAAGADVPPVAGQSG